MQQQQKTVSKKNQNIFMLSHLLCHCECSIRVIQTSWDFRRLCLGCWFWGGVCPAQVPGSAAIASSRHSAARMGSGCGRFGGWGLPQYGCPLPPAPLRMHYRGRAEDGSRNFVSLTAFCLLGKHSCEGAAAECRWGCDMVL